MGHDGPVNVLALGKEGEIISGSDDCTIKVTHL
jgi:hypothetical protein